MTWDEFWHGSLDRLHDYWQAYQFAVEARNRELWLQGLYIRSAIASCLDEKATYPDAAPRVTEMTPEEQAADKRRKLEKLREQLDEQTRRFKARKEV